MINIGIIGDLKNISNVKKVISKNLKDKLEYKMFYLNKIDNNILFDFDIIYIYNLKSVGNQLEYVKKILNRTKIIILNLDLDENLRKIKNMELNVITCGYTNKSTITVSSVSEDYIILFIQRLIQNINEKIIESKEIKIYFNKYDLIDNDKYNFRYKNKLKANNIISKNLKVYKKEQKILNVNILIGIASILLICGIENVKL